MTDQDFTRILAAVDGYWPGAQFNDNARKAWRQQLAPHTVDQILKALADYSAEGHPRPPFAGQLAARISPPSKARRGDGESELARATRQRNYAAELVKTKKMSKADFDFYDKDFWQPAIDQHTKAA